MHSIWVEAWMLLMQSSCSPVSQKKLIYKYRYTNTQMRKSKYTNTQYMGRGMDAADAILLFTGDEKYKYTNTQLQIHKYTV